MAKPKQKTAESQMVLTPPEVGQENWGEDLNAYLNATEARTLVNDARIEALEARILSLETRVDDLEEETEVIFHSAPWQFSNSAPPATGNQLRFDNTDPALAAMIDFRNIDTNGADQTGFFQIMAPGAIIRVQDYNEAGVFHRFRVTGSPTYTTDNTNFPVVWEDGAGTLPNAKVSVGLATSFKL